MNIFTGRSIGANMNYHKFDGIKHNLKIVELEINLNLFVMDGLYLWKNQTNCCVQHCFSTNRKSNDLSFFKFPPPERLTSIVDASGNESIVNVRQEWISKLNIKREVTPYIRVCSLHFANSDILSGRVGRRQIKSYAIPSRNLPPGTKSEECKELPVIASSILSNVLQSASNSCRTSSGKKCYSGRGPSSKECFPPIKLQRCSYDFAAGAGCNTEKFAEYDIKPKLEKTEEQKTTNKAMEEKTTSADLRKKCYVGPAAKQLQQTFDDELEPLSVIKAETMEPINQMSSEELIEGVQGTESLQPAIDMLDAVSSTGEKIQIEVYKIQ